MHIDEQFDGNSAGLMNRVPVDPYEIEREAVIAMLEREQRSLTASLIALALMAVGVAAMPNPLPMTVLLALRFCSFLYTRKAAARLEQLARARQPMRSARWILVFAMSLTGVTLGLMLWPPPPDGSMVAVNLVRGVVLVAATLAAVTLAALPAARDAMLASFWLTTFGYYLFHPGVQHPAQLLDLGH